MNRSDQERTNIVRTWLEEGSIQLSPRVHDAVLREFPRIAQDGAFGSWRVRMTAYATVAVAAVALVVVVLVGPRLLPGIVPGGVAPPATPSPTGQPTLTPEDGVDRSYREIGYIGLPPPGAVSSDPERTDLVESFWLPRNSGAGYRGAVFVYADGRMIWNEYYADGSASTGWLEQRLTDEGIELVRDLALQTSEPEVPRKVDPALLPGLLPASAWADPTVRPYVPTGFAACVFVAGDAPYPASGVDPSATLPQMLAMLPMEARELLIDRTPVPSLLDEVEGPDENDFCLGMPTADARRLDAALHDGGLDQDGSRNRWLLEYHLQLGAFHDFRRLDIWFEPILPDGAITCSSCG